jgi:hypothetical protein
MFQVFQAETRVTAPNDNHIAVPFILLHFAIQREPRFETKIRAKKCQSGGTRYYLNIGSGHEIPMAIARINNTISFQVYHNHPNLNMLQLGLIENAVD